MKKKAKKKAKKKPLVKRLPATKPKSRNDFTITVTVTNNGISVSDVTKTLDKNYDDRATWICVGGTMRVIWGRLGKRTKGSNPFTAKPFAGKPKKTIRSGKITGDPDDYYYSLMIYPTSNPDKPITIDPQIEVIDTGGGPGGHGLSGSGPAA